MTKQLLILIDVDGVLADFAGSFINLANELFHRGAPKLTVDQVTDFDFAKCGILTESQVHTLFAAIAADSNFTRCLPVLPGAREALADLREIGRVVAVTSPLYAGEWVNGRVDWLKGLGFKETAIVFCKDKSLVRGDLLIDDGEHNIKTAMTDEAFMINAPWNAKSTWGVPRGDLKKAVAFAEGLWAKANGQDQ